MFLFSGLLFQGELITERADEMDGLTRKVAELYAWFDECHGVSTAATTLICADKKHSESLLILLEVFDDLSFQLSEWPDMFPVRQL